MDFLVMQGFNVQCRMLFLAAAEVWESHEKDALRPWATGQEAKKDSNACTQTAISGSDWESQEIQPWRSVRDKCVQIWTLQKPDQYVLFFLQMLRRAGDPAMRNCCRKFAILKPPSQAHNVALSANRVPLNPPVSQSSLSPVRLPFLVCSIFA